MIDDDRVKAMILYKKGVDAMEDGVLVIAESFFSESLNYDPKFAEAYLLRAVVKRALLPKDCRDDSLIKRVGNDLLKALELKPSLVKAVDDVVNNRLTPENHKSYHS